MLEARPRQCEGCRAREAGDDWAPPGTAAWQRCPCAPIFYPAMSCDVFTARRGIVLSPIARPERQTGRQRSRSERSARKFAHPFAQDAAAGYRRRSPICDETKSRTARYLRVVIFSWRGPDMANALSLRTAEMIGQRLRREFYADEASAAVWQSLSQLTRAEFQRQPWRPNVGLDTPLGRQQLPLHRRRTS
jgi:hypothetical protein